MWVDQRGNQRKENLLRRVGSGETRDPSNHLGSACKTLNQRQHDRDVSDSLDRESFSFPSFSFCSCSIPCQRDQRIVAVDRRWDPFLGLFALLEKEVSGPRDSVEGVGLIRSGSREEDIEREGQRT